MATPRIVRVAAVQIAPDFDGQKFFTRLDGRRLLTPLFLVVALVETTDLLFAVDSIPAVLSISHNPFVVYTSNIAAVLGLRSLYFALASLLNRFRYLHYGLGAMLAFVALKMLAARWLEIPITLSLAVMGAILSVCAVASWIAAGKEAREQS